MQKKNYGLLAYILVCVVWGSTYLATRIGVQSFPHFLFGSFRQLIAGSIILLYSYLKKLEFPKEKNEYFKICVAGFFLLGISNSLVITAQTRVNSSTAALIAATASIMMVIIEHFVPGGCRVSLTGWLGFLVSFAGVGILSFSKGGKFDTDIIGIGLLLIANIAWAVGSVYSRRTIVKGSMIVHIGIQMLTGGLAQGFMAIITGDVSQLNPEPSAIWALAYLIVMGSLVGYTSYIYLINAWPISKASTYAYINPIVAMFLGWLILSESINAKMIISTTLILVGVSIVQRSRLVEKPEAKIEA